MGIFDRWLKPTTKNNGSITTPDQLYNAIAGNTHSAYRIGSYVSDGAVREIYEQNPVGRQCVDIIATNLGAVKLSVWRADSEGNKVEITDVDHPIVKLVNRPNPTLSGNEFLSRIAYDLMLYGNSFIEGVGTDAFRNGNGELHFWRNSRTNILENGGTFPNAYQYSPSNGNMITIDVDDQSGLSRMLHIKLYNPTDEYRGLAPASAAYPAVVTFNAGQEWNYNTLKNFGNPPLIASLKEGDLTEEQQLDYMQKLKNQTTGMNAGQPLVTGGEWDFKELGRSPKDMEFNEGLNTSARNIARAFGVPSQMLGIPGDNTYANMEAATLGLFNQRVLPLMDLIATDLTIWLAQYFGSEYSIGYNIDSVPALEEVRSKKAESIASLGDILTVDERREALGYEPLKPTATPEQN